ncbi:hypothetical protein AB6N23_16590 [Cellulomonas sp. 179-A 9B4 NHS]|uniref:hypothetical protein n=1 Tax=Cellulomonas sp. 179-A 9B4 NHS TaxID=3142379 RepID=UPI0039A3C34D
MATRIYSFRTSLDGYATATEGGLGAGPAEDEAGCSTRATGPADASRPVVRTGRRSRRRRRPHP